MKVEKNLKVAQKLLRSMPAVNQRVIVNTPHFSCLACLGRDGKWHAFYSDEILPDVVSWEPL